ncbi:MAG: Do family serine endopeptidase, partial [Calditrichia bacterium]
NRMEMIKKILVLITSLILIGSVIYLFSISSMKKAATPPGDETTEMEQPDSTGEFNPPPPRVSERTPDIHLKEQVRDSIHWNQSGTEQGQGSSGLDARRINRIFSQAAKRILPTVVSIRNTQAVENLPESHPFVYPPGIGSGIIISDNGYILTNFHVVSDARELQVTLYDKREFAAEYIGGDPTTDIALLKIDAEDLPSAKIGDSDKLQIGEWVLAIGNPLNFNSTITAGIISAFGRDINIINEEYRIENFIQTDAVINPGNSGGALANLDGEVIGINTAIATRTGFNQGYGFAIPSNLARRVIEDLVHFGYVKRGLLGVSIGLVDANAARGSGLSKPQGVLIHEVRKGYPAETAGLHEGDIILAVDGRKVNSPNDLQIEISKNRPGSKVTLSVWRDKSAVQLDVILAEAPISNSTSAPHSNGAKLQFDNLGLVVREPGRQEALPGKVPEGVYVEKVAYGSPAQEAGIFPSDIIVEINDQKVRSVDEFQQYISKAASGDVLKFFLAQRDSSGEILTRLVFVEVP